ncbi:helix-turn-helix domain-containing protein [Enterococcus sp. JM9B]|uniref:helix-turn-helix domain-containing protein n=1 Tax=Enterococcus sp. JM9B TaxID=1857216 RepID=UPI001374D691|nr:helix-turn-helix transcriptional regulator [Enterococcus sp. JM9B]KAF1303561.1 hypothetical protein BAU16_04255 [Enterococcus sp. JM9B]
MFDLIIDQYVYWENKKSFLLNTDTDSQWIVYIIEDGSCKFMIDKHSGIARSGDVLVCPPYTKFDREIREDLTFHFFRFSFKNEHTSFSEQLNYPLEPANIDRVLINATLLKRGAYDNSIFCNDYRELLLKDILMLNHLNKYDLSIDRLSIDYKDPLIKKTIIALSDFGTSEEVSINEIAHTFSVNASYLSRKFKKVTKYTPIEYRSKLRVRRAQKLLIETDDTLETIAEKCGFANGFYLSRVFTKYLGICPSQYRAQHKI